MVGGGKIIEVHNIPWTLFNEFGAVYRHRIFCEGPEGGETDVSDVVAGQAADGSGEEAETLQGKPSLTWFIYFIFRNKQEIGRKAETIQG